MSVVVLYDGRRKKVAVTAGTSMADVLSKACEALGIASDAIEMRHKNSLVDLSLPFRLTGISTNATLELLEKKSNTGDAVRVCVQQTDGRRLQGSFSSSLTLATIVTQLKVHFDAANDTLLFMRREIKGNELNELTLQALGLVSGSVIFRVQKDASGLIAPIPVAQPTPQIAPQPIKQQQTTSLMHTTPTEPLLPSAAPVIASTPVDPKKTTPFDVIQSLLNSNFDAVSKEVIVVLMKILCNILSKPGEEKVRSIRVNNPKFYQSVGRHASAMDFLLSVGFNYTSDRESITLENEDSNTLREALSILDKEANNLSIESSLRPKVIESTVPAEFSAFQPLITRMQAQPRGSSITEMRLEDLKKKQDELLSASIPPRNARVIFPHELQNITSEVIVEGKSDSQLLAQAMKTRQDQAEKNQMFRTSAMRELEEMQRKSVFQQAIIRVRFPDKVVLQAAFHPNEPLSAVMEVVKESLNQPLNFYFYITPPMQKLNMNQTLLQLQLVPASNIFLGWHEAPQDSAVGGYFNEVMLHSLCAESKGGDDSMTNLQYPTSRPLSASKAKTVEAKAEAKQSTQPLKTGKAKGRPAWFKL
ncbi:hypothetical protein THRCLA_02993 [Thraustotheca clavata]|uniref:UBX domain-containing protein n=1 Tax=Thraustotheca clavata TaxID=74557 RepID=A0A1W0A3G9_9STRA|nr:hypothetical protein THRCLA_02993 [Thraustotheca clavata]